MTSAYQVRRYPSICKSFWRRIAKVRFVRGVANRVVEHAVDRRRDRLQSHHAGKDRAIADLGVDHKSRTLGDLHRVKFRSAGTKTFFDIRGSRNVEQFLLVDLAPARADFRA